MIGRAIAYLRSLAARAAAGPRCPICGEEQPTKDDWLLHLGLEHPIWAEAYRGALHPDVLYRWIETNGDKAGNRTPERVAWLHHVARSIYGRRYPA